MNLAGLQKNSFIDYPGKVSCVLFTTGCNFTCPYCHNPALARGEYPNAIALDDVLVFLKSRRGMLDGVAITGGEPTVESGLVDLCRAVKSLGYSVKLDTNGSRPGVLAQMFSLHLVDYVAMDIKAPLGDYQPFCRNPTIQNRLKASIRIIMAAAPAYEFRTTCVRPFIDENAIQAIAQTIQGARCFALQRFNRRAHPYLDPAFGHRHDPSIGDDDMLRLQRIAQPLVGRCMIR